MFGFSSLSSTNFANFWKVKIEKYSPPTRHTKVKNALVNDKRVLG
jgi:hypothetical protein